MATIVGGSIVWNLKVNAAKFKRSLNDASRSVKKVGNNIRGQDSAVRKLSGSIVGLAGAYVGTRGLVSAFTQTIRVTAKFEQQMSDVSTLISGDASGSIDGLKDGINELLKTVPKSADELGASVYSIVSAGITDTAKALETLEASAILATAGLGTTAQATDLMTSSLNAFAIEELTAARASDILFTAVKRGKTTVAELSQGFGAVAASAAGLGVKFDELLAATASMTTIGLPAVEAYTQLTSAMKALSKPTKAMKELLNKVGFESGQTAIESVGLVVALRKVIEAGEGNNEVLIEAFGRIEGFKAALSLAGPVAEAYNATIEDMRDGISNVDEAFAKQNETATAQFQILKNQLNVVMRELGTEIMPTVISGARKLTDLVGQMTTGFQELKEPITFVGKAMKFFIDQVKDFDDKSFGAKLGLSALGPIGPLLGTIGGRASGGPVQANRPFIVGEAGPEVFVPKISGNIIPNGEGGGSTFNFNISEKVDLTFVLDEVKRVLGADALESNFGINK